MLFLIVSVPLWFILLGDLKCELARKDACRNNISMPDLRDAIVGCLLGTAVGDALGLWCEGMSPQRQQRCGKDLARFHFICGHGMVSDDTEHACMTAQALIVSGGDEDRFQRSLAWRLRWWLIRIPAGIGFATLRAILKLWLGFSPRRSGVFSAGNGPAMRSPILGVCFGGEPVRLRALVRACTRVTHTDPKAEHGAHAVAVAANLAVATTGDLGEIFLRRVREELPDSGPFLQLLERAVRSAQTGQPTEEFAVEMGLAHGVTGYIYHTVPVVIQAWLRHGSNVREALPAIIRCGGDTDTAAAILGGILGAATGKRGLPAEWLARLWEWPCSSAWIEELGTRLADAVTRRSPGRPLGVFLPGLLLRNLLFLIIVLGHGFRRLL